MMLRSGVLLILAAGALSGCGREGTDKAATREPAPVATTTLEKLDGPTDRETWEVLLLQGKKVGYTHTRLGRATLDGQPIVQIESTTRVLVQRSSQSVSPTIRVLERDAPDGRLLEVEGRFALGGEPVLVHARADGQRLLVRSVPDGRIWETVLPWAPDAGGLAAVEQSLRARPMKPGEKRSVRGLTASLNQLLPATFELAAGQIETTTLPGRARSLLRIDLVTRPTGGTDGSAVLWTDGQGEVLKTRQGGDEGPETYRVDRTEALAEAEGGPIDLVTDTIVKAAWPAADPHGSKRARFRVRLASGDPAKAFVSGRSQVVRSLDERAAEVTVVAIRPGSAPKAPPGEQPTAEDSAPNALIQSDDSRVVEMARQAVGDRQAAWDRAVALEGFVHETVTRKDFSQAFATAADVAQSRQGDCTEHAVLLAAMARAVGIPARVAVGLVYVERAGGFGFHMWTEVFVEGAWIPLDATLGRGGIGAAHLKVAHGSFQGADVPRCLDAVTRVLMQVKIDVLEVQ